MKHEKIQFLYCHKAFFAIDRDALFCLDSSKSYIVESSLRVLKNIKKDRKKYEFKRIRALF